MPDGGKPRFARLLLVQLVALLLGTATANAAPGDDATLVTAPLTAASMQVVTTATATCPAGQRLVGGGSAPAGTVDASFLSLRASAPLDETGTVGSTNSGDVASIWSASLTNQNPTPMSSYPERVFANCSANSDATLQVSTASLAGSATQALTTSCPAGTRAVGGGFSSIGAQGDFLLRASGPVDETGLTDNTFTGDVARGWRVLATNVTASTKTFSALALCSAASDATVALDSFFADPGVETTKFITCPTGKRALGGGTGTTGAVGPYLTASAPIAAGSTPATTTTGEAARGWSASAFNATGVAQLYLVFALCAGDTGTGTPPPDTTAPETTLTEAPKKLVKTRRKKTKVTFAFGSSEAGSSFECELDGRTFAPCDSPFSHKVRSSRRGKRHSFSVVAIDAVGNRDATPANRAWRVKKTR